MTRTDSGLGATLRAWRDRTSPRAVGLPEGRRRRSPGLRREELAQLVGLSVDYVVRLEQGRATAPSAQVCAALARSLQLSPVERDHLYRLAGLAPPQDGAISDHVPRGLQRVLTQLSGSAVAVFAADWRMVWWNASWAALVGDPSTTAPERRNFALTRFPADEQAGIGHWPVVNEDADHTDLAVVSDLRRATGRFPHDPRLTALLDRLQQDDRFAELWATGTVGTHREDHKTVLHPEVGPIEVDCDTLVDGDAEMKLVVLSAAPGSEDETKLRLALVAGVSSSSADRVSASTRS